MSDSFLVAIEICPLCSSTRRKFTCQDCVQKGNFTFSNKGNSDSFVEKKERNTSLIAEKGPLFQRIEKYHFIRSAKEQKRLEIFALKVKLGVLAEAVSSVKNENSCDCQKLKIKKDSFKLNFEEVEKLKAKVLSYGEKLKIDNEILNEQKHKLVDTKSKVVALRKTRIKSLLCDIFPIFTRTVYSEFGTPPRATISTRGLSNDLILEASLTAETELEEATKCTYEGGQWIQASLSETEYCIVEPGLPSSGDYVKYYEWLKSHRKEVRDPESDTEIHTHTALGIPAALTYTAQAVKMASIILDANLPNKLHFRDFGDPYMCQKKLMDAVSKLNVNIMQLCFGQIVNQELLSPMQTIRNLDVCLSKENQNLGHIGPFQTYDFYLPEIFNDSDSSIDDLQLDSDSDNEYFSGEDWDSLTDLPDLPKDVSFQQSQTSPVEQSLSVSATGLVTSAAASVASLWPWKKS